MTSEPLDVFISWSGTRSSKIADALTHWLGDLFPKHVKIWTSGKDLEAGGPWSSDLFTRLGKEERQFGILCVTPENIVAPWLLFEAGALAKRVMAKDRAVPYLFQLEPANTIGNPLSHLQQVKADKEGTRALVRSLNKSLPDDRRLDEGVLERAFERQWEELEAKLTASDLQAGPAAPAPPPEREILQEILGTVRSLANSVQATNIRVASLEAEVHPSRAWVWRRGRVIMNGEYFRPTAEREADEIAEKVARLLTTGQALGILLDRLSDRTQGGPETDAKPDAGDEAKTE